MISILNQVHSPGALFHAFMICALQAWLAIPFAGPAHAASQQVIREQRTVVVGDTKHSCPNNGEEEQLFDEKDE
jgi:hypothetical protein